MHRISRLLLALSAFAFAGCGPAESSFLPAEEGEPNTTAAAGATHEAKPCTDGSKKACVQVYGEHAGIVSCYEGERTCIGGAWGPCVPLPDEPTDQGLH
jgi:hypothetical protein